MGFTCTGGGIDRDFGVRSTTEVSRCESSLESLSVLSADEGALKVSDSASDSSSESLAIGLDTSGLDGSSLLFAGTPRFGNTEFRVCFTAESSRVGALGLGTGRTEFLVCFTVDSSTGSLLIFKDIADGLRPVDMAFVSEVGECGIAGSSTGTPANPCGGCGEAIGVTRGLPSYNDPLAGVADSTAFRLSIAFRKSRGL